MPYCDKCGKYTTNIKIHKCPPVFEVRREESDDNEWEEVNAYDEEGAAETWAEEDDTDSAEYSIVSGEVAIVLVRKKGSKTAKKFEVSGEAMPTYSAYEID